MKPSPHELFALARGRVGEAAAARLARFQLAHVGALTALCRREGWDSVAECREVETVDLYLDERARDKAFGEVRELAKHVPEFEMVMWGEEEARKKFETNSQVKGALSYTAGALWPFRFVSCVWKDLLARFGEEHLSIETDTGVLSISVAATDDDDWRAPYRVVTQRGTIAATHVVHASNAFATEFVPGLRGKMTGVVGHMSAQRPGRAFPDQRGNRSWSVMYGTSFDYVTQRPPVRRTAAAADDDEDGTPGDIMLGGGLTLSTEQGMDALGVWDDSKVDPLPAAHLAGIFPAIFAPAWGDEAEGGRTRATWTGILATTGDMLPFVGRLDPKLTGRRPPAPPRPRHRHRLTKAAAPAGPSEAEKQLQDEEENGGVRPGEWISAGYCGDGMVWAWGAGEAVGMMLAGSEDEIDGWFPRELEPSLERVRKADLENLAGQLF
ncbi:hypothetical protein GGR56DRAFT_612846 [Xylariaceae sp. FL0804]|nr:hypothetical protein GGR56DRAFT_612846 [Xylariaceae sp. FL0804]